VRLRRVVALGTVACLFAALPSAVATADEGSEDVPVDPPAPREFTVAVSGDIIPLPSLVQKAKRNGKSTGTAYDFAPMLADIAPLISAADLAICHLEIPVAPPGTKPTGFPKWSTPPEIVDAIVGAGYDRCSTASNHTFDKGNAGVKATLDAFDAKGLGHSGSARTPEEAIPQIFEVNGVKVAHLSYSYGFNHLKLKPPDQWRANQIDVAKILAAAADVRSRGAEVVILSMHWGAEMSQKVRPKERAIAEQLTASGLIDVIVGHHPHVMQPIEQLNGKWVLWSLGNLMSNHRPETAWPAASEDGAVVSLHIVELPEGGFTVERPVVHPTWSQPVTLNVFDAIKHRNDTSLSRSVLRRLVKSLTRTTKLLGAYLPP